MVEETIQAIRETEGKAGAIVKDAEVQCRNILEQASNEAEKLKTDQLSKVRTKAASDSEEAKMQGAQSQEKAAADVEKEVLKLKEAASARAEEAVNLVIERLV